jgi:hypothetical protein
MAAGLPCQKQFCVTVAPAFDACAQGIYTPEAMLWTSSYSGPGTGTGNASSGHIDTTSNGNALPYGTLYLNSQICSASGGTLRFSVSGTFYRVLGNFAGSLSAGLQGGGWFGASGTMAAPPAYDVPYAVPAYDVPLVVGVNNIGISVQMTGGSTTDFVFSYALL